ncbi:fluG protein [Paecilomyces variotii No. 5]|uniref:FluG protein n=1 Tax=Byssochlamys spectabilis (strain No. 5 / NBRC 109023) TaxID=1356009 RepID=V5G4Y2_BYSSN|nr:fluG protein [Paecilomyces variotii No. 5]
MCSIVEKLPQNGNRPDSTVCPRIALREVLDVALRRWGIRFLVGFEVELVILRENKNKNIEDHQFVPLCSGPGHYSVASIRDSSFHYLDECVTELMGAGVDIHDFHVEGTTGQFENSLAPLTPMAAVDELVRVHDMVKSIVSRHGYIATMVPRLSGLRQGTGQHIHISLSPSDREECFLAGLLNHLPGICAVTMPYSQSYARVGKLEAGEWADWSTENRDVAVRKIESGHWEIRCADACANMYLALATILAAGLLGVQHQHPLMLSDASLVSDSESANSDVPAKLPRKLEDALQLLQESLPQLHEILNNDILHDYVALKQVESGRMAQLDREEMERLMVTLF